MAEITSAGTLVAAVLETAGFLTQARLLEDFRAFFMAGGGLIWIIAGIGGLISIVLYGSFRAARYLLIGPALYWMLIGPTTPVQGVMWKLGGGEAQSKDGTTTPQGSAQYVREVVGRTNADGTAVQSNVPVEASTVFVWFTTLISDIINEAIDVVLQHENDKDLLFVNKTQALEYLSAAKLTNPEVLNMLEEDLYVGCRDMMNAALAASNIGLSERNEEQWRLSAATATGGNKDALLREADKIKQLRELYKGKFDQFSQTRVNPGIDTVNFMSRYEEQPGAVRTFLDKYPGKKAKELGTDVSMSCGELWEISQQAILAEAEKIDKDIYTRFQGELSDPAKAKPLLCSALQEKIGNVVAATENCNLVEAAYVYLLRNSLNQDALSRIVQKHRNRFQGYKTLEAGTIMTIGGDDDSEIISSDLGNAEVTDENGQLKVTVTDAQGNKSKKSFLRLGIPIYGQVDSAFKDHLRYQTRELKQKIFTWAMNIPYWQGTILYLIAIAYPFLALVVLIPGRAQAFLNVPLAWLWIKSWDLGFAVVRVFEKIIWNLFPNQDLPVNPTAKIEELTTGVTDAGATALKLPDVLQEAFKADPLYHVHSYYYLLSLALLSVPSITGYATLKAKRSILSSFTDGPGEDAKSASNIAGNIYGMNQMNERLQQSYALNAAAMQGQGSWGVGLSGEGRNGSAAAWAGVSAAGKMINSDGLKSGGKAALGDLAKQYPDLIGTMAKSNAQIASLFGSTFGRWSPPQTNIDANAAALDGTKTFEVNNADTIPKVLEADRSVFTAKVDIAIDAAKDVVLKGVSTVSGKNIDVSKENTAKEIIVGVAKGAVKAAPGVIMTADWANGGISDGDESSSREPSRSIFGTSEHSILSSTGAAKKLFDYGVDQITPAPAPTYDSQQEITRK